jgi:quercetin dioxygenase-like cupin family protein
MTNYVTKSAEKEWTPLVEGGVKTDGIWVKVLRSDEGTKRAPTFLLKFDAGASYPKHRHPAGEEAFVLEGEVSFGERHLSAGDYLYTPPEGIHSVYSRSGCVLLFIVPEEVQILAQGS